jgi:PTH1 family peptidyl-tRNA hydrolase
MMMDLMDNFLIIGLGNPGREYRQTRHNVGFMVLDLMAKRLNARFLHFRSRALVADAKFKDRSLILAKPQTFMNLSGQSVIGLLHHYELSTPQMMVIHDDLDLQPGTIRLRPEGGSAGQKGVASILDRLGTQDFPRLRIGIGHPPIQKHTVDYVLDGFTAFETSIISDTLDRAVDAVLVWVTDGIEIAMNRFNGNSY